MKTKTDIESQLGKLTEADKTNIETIISRLNDLLQNDKLTEDTIQALNSAELELRLLAINYSSRLIKLLKANVMI